MSARAQNVQPLVDCVEPERDSAGALTGKYTAYFGYNNLGTSAAFIPINTSGNTLTPIRNPPGQPNTFLPGVHSRVFFVAGIDTAVGETWRLSAYLVTSSITQSPLCSDNQNARLITYQGKLSDGGQAANGVYDMYFQLYNAATGGEQRTRQILIENVTVENGIFTVKLDLGANSIVNGVFTSQPINPAILAGEDAFLEIGVRPDNSPAAFTALTPRQPLTAVPFAMRANTANNAVRAAFAGYADYGNNNFQVIGDAFIKVHPASLTGGNFNVEKNLTVGGTINGTATNAISATNATNAANADKLGGVAASQYVKTNSAGDLTVGCRSGFTPIANGRLCVSAMQPAATFYNAAQACTNMGARLGNSADARLSFTQSGFNYFEIANPVNNNNPKGWLADIVGDDVSATWNVNSPNQNFDGTPLNVNSGGSGGTAPQLLYRCVY
jgi:hypothetical protein